MDHSVVGVVAPVGSVGIVEPVDIVDELVGLCSKADGLDVQVVETEAVWAHSQVLRLNCHELWVEPRPEHLSVERLPPLHVVIVVGVLKLHGGHVGLDLANFEEHVVDFIVGVSVRSAKLVGLSDSLFHLERVHDGKGDIVAEDGLALALHAFDLPKHPVEHLHVHAPLGSDRRVRVQSLHNVSRSKDSDIWADSFDLLLTNPLGSQTLALRVRIGTSGRDVDEALNLGRVLDCLGNSHGHTNVSLLKVLLLLVEDVGADAGNGNV